MARLQIREPVDPLEPTIWFDSVAMGTAPPWLAPIGRDMLAGARIEEIGLNSGPATLVVERRRVSVIWSVPDRVYVLSGYLSRKLTIAAANAVE